MKLIEQKLYLLKDENIETPSTLYKTELDAFNITKDIYWYNRYLKNLSICKGEGRKE